MGSTQSAPSTGLAPVVSQPGGIMGSLSSWLQNVQDGLSTAAKEVSNTVSGAFSSTPVAPLTSTTTATATLGTAPGDTMLGGKRRRKTGKKSRKLRKKTVKSS
jgi:predicted AlkP superfamily phosphohydrolase/phosphomutase